MKRLFLFISFIFLCIAVFSQATTGTRVTAPLVPNDSSDVYPTHDAYFGRDGYRSVITLTERDNIKTALRKEGMQVYCKEDSSIYQLRNGITNGNWFKIVSTQDTTSEWVSRTIYISLPTDPQTPGSDITGTGSALLPFATILKALKSIKQSIKVGAIITLQLDSGTFDFSQSERDEINKRILSATDYGLTISGQMVKLNSYSAFTLAADANDFTKFTVTGTTFTVNELKDLFLGNSGATLFSNIESNTSNIIYSIGATTYNNIYRCNTTLNLKSIATQSYLLNFNRGPSQYTVRFLNVKLTPTTGVVLYTDNVTISNCILTISSGNLRTPRNGRLSIFNSTIYVNPTNDNSYTVSGFSGSSSYFYQVLIKSLNATRFSWGFCPNTSECYAGLWISGFKSAFSNVGGSISDINSQGNAYLKISNCTNVIQSLSTSFASMAITFNKLVLDNVDYLLYNTSNSAITFNSQTLVGNFNLALFNTSSTYKNLVNIVSKQFINIPNIYPEIQQKLTSALADNSTDSISIGDKSYNRSIEIKYNITRGTDYRTGTLKVLNTGTTLLFDPGDFLQTNDIGVTFNGAFYSGGSNTIKLKWTTTNTGTAATIIYDAFRQNY